MFERTDLSVQVQFQAAQSQHAVHRFIVEPSPTALKPIMDDEDENTKKQTENVPQNDESLDGYGAKTDLELLSTAIGERPEDIEAMYAYKLQVCPNKLPHDWTQCHFAHEGEVARRRNPAAHSANPCAEYEKSGQCHRGDRCPFAHGVWERGLHPQRYRTSLCSKGEACNRKICFFAHLPSQIRKSVSGFHHAGLAGFHGFAGMQGSENAPLVGKVSRRRRQHQHEKQAERQQAEKKALQEAAAGRILDAGSASFVPGEAPAKAVVDHPPGAPSKPQTAAHASATDADAAPPAGEEASAGPAPQPFEGQRRMENSMLWAQWAKKSPGTGEEREGEGDGSGGSLEETEWRALERFNTGWVDGLLREDSARALQPAASPPAEGESRLQAGNGAGELWGGGMWGGGLSVRGHNREWTRWVMAPVGATRDEGDAGKVEGEKGRLAELRGSGEEWADQEQGKSGGDGEGSSGGRGLEGHAKPISPPSGPGAMKEQDGKSRRGAWGEVEAGEAGDSLRPPALFLGIHPSLLDPLPQVVLQTPLMEQS